VRDERSFTLESFDGGRMRIARVASQKTAACHSAVGESAEFALSAISAARIACGSF
jgi:hypothetical protein